MIMSAIKAIKAIWKNGQVLLDRPADWPEGRRLVVTEDRPADIEFMTKDEQSDDPAAIERWIEELGSLPALTMTPEEEAELRMSMPIDPAGRFLNGRRCESSAFRGSTPGLGFSAITCFAL